MNSKRQMLPAALLVAAIACVSAAPAQQGPGNGTDGGTGGATDGGVAGLSSAAQVAQALGRTPHFLIGLGNDLRGAPDYDHNQDGAYTLGTTLDLHYAYLVGLLGMGGWPDWNAGGTFVNILADTAKAHAVTPMFTLYSMAAWGEGNTAVLTNDQYMKAYWDGAKLLYQRIAAFGGPALVHFEPDFWGFTQVTQGDPAKMAVHVKANAPDCAALPDDVTGMGKCLVKLARLYAPKAVVGFHASPWAAGNPADLAQYLVKIGAGEGDLVVIDVLDRDAGCFEAHTDPGCQRGSASDKWYWDETNQTSPNFHEHLTWAKALSDGTGKPLLWWQMPLGVPSSQRGGTAGHYRDNRAHYLFTHTSEFVAAGGVGAVFGVGAGNQTDITTDGDQFKTAAQGYILSPTPLP
ncbi:MAG TPA: hypothetical protein VMK66_07160 [Myxococcales bacterium]|nr:hypothetical protein [Myxococcales bacterium]